MAISNIKEFIRCDIEKVWETVLAVDMYRIWRSDLSGTEIINSNQFVEHTKNGYST